MSPWEPSGTWKRDYALALQGAFPFVQDIDLVLDEYFDIPTLQNIAPVGPGVNYNYQIRQLINRAQSQDWLLDLVAATQERRPKNEELCLFASELGLMLTGPRLDNPYDAPFEAMVNQAASLIDFAKFLDGLAVLQGQICFVDVPGGGGTGFLIGPDLVLTNDHVIEAVLRPGSPEPAAVKCRFDYKEAFDGTALTRNQAREVALADGNSEEPWLVDRLPKSKADENPDLGDPTAKELDYAILRLAERIGDNPIGPQTSDLDASPRGWIDVTFDPPWPGDGNQVFLLQHPQREPLQLAVGAVTATNGNGTRLRYDANSKKGSSGSPCFNADLQLVALHHAREPAWPPTWNQAVPITTIRSEWQITPESPPE